MAAGPDSVFARIVCGVDETPASAEAARQARRLVTPGGTLLLVAAVDVATAAQAGFRAPAAAERAERETREALDRVAAELDGADTRLVAGRAPHVLLAAVREADATLVALGTHERRRAAGIALGTVGATMLHQATSSVLIARPVDDRAEFPRSVAAGVDGSPESATAAETARALGARFSAPVRAVAATGGKGVHERALGALGDVEPVSGAPVRALVEVSDHVDLLVVGSRGLHGVRAIGSVSERVAHEAACSVLVVRRSDGA